MKNWLVTEQKQTPLALLNSDFTPKLIVNLADNAFTAALETNDLCRAGMYEKPNVGRFLTVSNNGKPILPAVGKEIFEPGISSKKDPLNNHGWGLVICRRIAEELGGVLSYESTSACTTFKLFLPAKRVPTALAHYPSIQFEDPITPMN